MDIVLLIIIFGNDVLRLLSSESSFCLILLQRDNLWQEGMGNEDPTQCRGLSPSVVPFHRHLRYDKFCNTVTVLTNFWKVLRILTSIPYLCYRNHRGPERVSLQGAIVKCKRLCLSRAETQRSRTCPDLWGPSLLVSGLERQGKTFSALSHV